MFGQKCHIYLSGFMGSGKSAAGIILASLLHLPFYDTDFMIELKTGKKVAEIFRRKGEAFFRREETKLLISLQASSPGVVALGGGMVLSATNREILRRGIWFNLRASLATALSRIGKTTGRPLLKKGVSSEEISSLLNRRRPLYDLAPNQIETEGLAPDAVAEMIAKKIRRGTLP